MYAFDSRIRYSETDSEGYLTLDALLNYFQDCSTFHSEDVGLGIGYMKEIGQVWVLSSWQIVVNRYPKLGEKVKIVTLPYELKVFLGYRNFAMLDEQGEYLAKANSLWSLLDVGTGKPVMVNEAMHKGYEIDEKLDMVCPPQNCRAGRWRTVGTHRGEKTPPGHQPSCKQWAVCKYCHGVSAG